MSGYPPTIATWPQSRPPDPSGSYLSGPATRKAEDPNFPSPTLFTPSTKLPPSPKPPPTPPPWPRHPRHHPHWSPPPAASSPLASAPSSRPPPSPCPAPPPPPSRPLQRPPVSGGAGSSGRRRVPPPAREPRGRRARCGPLAGFDSLRRPYRAFPIVASNRHVETIFAAFARSLPAVAPAASASARPTMAPSRSTGSPATTVRFRGTRRCSYSWYACRFPSRSLVCGCALYACIHRASMHLLVVRNESMNEI